MNLWDGLQLVLGRVDASLKLCINQRKVVLSYCGALREPTLIELKIIEFILSSNYLHDHKFDVPYSTILYLKQQFARVFINKGLAFYQILVSGKCNINF